MIVDYLEQTKAPVWKVSRHRLNTDGFGVTTLVVLWGCPLDCTYCINPGTKFKSNGGDYRVLTPRELYDKVKIDNLYFVHTHGGITFGGGEPLLRHQFIMEFAKICKNDKWRLRIETSLNVPNDVVRSIANVIDNWYVDIKDLSPDIYMAYTGSSNKQVIDNLSWLAGNGYCEKVTIRMPHIAGYNDGTHIQSSIERIKNMGFSSIEELEYLTPEKLDFKVKNPNPQRGKSICRRLKAVRMKIAERYGIPYIPHECNYDGPCLGTCPRCEKEVSVLESKILYTHI